MIIVKIQGGLGNQMFQYAAGKALAIKHNTELKLDINWFSNIEEVHTPRKFELLIFDITENFASNSEIAKFQDKKIIKFVIKNKKRIIEKSFNFDPEILNLPNNVYLEGYWQAENYFKSIEKIIRKDFSFKSHLEGKNREISKLMQDNSVSLHVRRSDYVNNPETNSFHGTCNLDYYSKAINLIAQKVNNPKIFVFSDDMEWVRKNLNIPYQTYFIEWNKDENSFEDMRLMSLCSYNIIANSSFSWWSAWLNQNPDKIVIAPQKWFNLPEINTHQDLIPEDWIRL